MPQDKIKIELWDVPGVFVVLERESGVIYSNQCGGTACSHPEVEGVLIPLIEQGDTLRFLCELTRDYWGKGELARMCRESRQVPNSSKVLRDLVQEFYPVGWDREKGPFLCLDWDRLEVEPNGEAWIPVKTQYGPGWLTMENSD